MSTEAVEIRGKPEVRRVKFRDFDPQEALKFLPDWEYHSSEAFELFNRITEIGQFFLEVKRMQREVFFAGSHRIIKLSDVREVEFDSRVIGGMLIFRSPKLEYVIEGYGSEHTLRLRGDNKSFANFDLPRPKRDVK